MTWVFLKGSTCASHTFAYSTDALEPRRERIKISIAQAWNRKMEPKEKKASWQPPSVRRNMVGTRSSQEAEPDYGGTLSTERISCHLRRSRISCQPGARNTGTPWSSSFTCHYPECSVAFLFPFWRMQLMSELGYKNKLILDIRLSIPLANGILHWRFRFIIIPDVN